MIRYMSKDPILVKQGARLREARSALFPTSAEAALSRVRKYADLSLSSLHHHENGTRTFVKFAEAYAAAYETDASWLLFGYEPVSVSEIPIVGKAAAGPDGYFLSDYDTGAHPTLPPFPDGSVAVELSGLSMWPRFQDGEKIVFGPQTHEIAKGIGTVVLAETEDGRQLIKVLKANRFTGRWDLLSYNQDFDPIEDIGIISVRTFEGLRA